MAPSTPTVREGIAVWEWQHADAEVLFTGRAARHQERDEVFAAVSGRRRPVAWARQVHGSDVLAAIEGCSGDGDALVTSDPGLVLAIATADCVPLLLEADGRVAAVHAGWRGVVAGVVRRAVRSLRHHSSAAVQAWIGPAIGGCCYEVGDEVAARVVAASTAEVVSDDRRPHVDLAAAVAWQLADEAVELTAIVRACTRCHPDWLWSYRRDGDGAGRNLAFIRRRAG